MSRNRLLASLAALAAVGTSSALSDVHLVAQGADSSFDAAPLYDCLAYQGCASTTYTLGAEGRLHIYTSKSLANVLQDFARCDFTTANVSALSYLEGDATVATPLDPSRLGISHPHRSSGSVWPGSRTRPGAEPSPTPKIEISPALIGEARMETLRTLADELPSQAAVSSVEKIVGALGLESLGYTLSIAKLGDDAAAVTRHDLKTIQFADDLRRGDVARVVRHEFEHVLQMRIATECGPQNAFGTHDVRERAAYLNDGHFAEEYEDFATTHILRYKNP